MIATATCLCTCSAAGIFSRPSSDRGTSTPAPARLRKSRASSRRFARATCSPIAPCDNDARLPAQAVARLFRLCSHLRCQAHRSCPHPVRRSDLRHDPARASDQIRPRLGLSLRRRMASGRRPPRQPRMTRRRCADKTRHSTPPPAGDSKHSPIRAKSATDKLVLNTARTRLSPGRVRWTRGMRNARLERFPAGLNRVPNALKM